MKKFQKFLMHLAALILGIALGAFIVFQVLFLMKVLPHGGF